MALSLGLAVSGAMADPAAVQADSQITPTGPLDTPKDRADQIERDKLAGVSAFEHSDFVTARDYFRRVRQIDPADDEAMFLLGRAYLAHGEAANAAEQFTDAVIANDKVEKYFYARAKAEVKLGRYADAIVDFNRDLDLRGGKGSSTFYLSRGDANFGSGRTELAIQDYGLALDQATPEDLRAALLHRGIALAWTKDYERALSDLDAAEAAGRAANSTNFDTYLYRGVVEELKGDKTSAGRDYKAAATYANSRKGQAACLAAALEPPRFHLFGRSRGCKGINAAKALQTLPPL
ncbi:MAG TPA: tetratricopeptide repeat protein [Caulobacteraceae bacterium]